MSAPIDTNDNNIIITDSNELAERSKGGVEHVSPGDTDSTSASDGSVNSKRLNGGWIRDQ